MDVGEEWSLDTIGPLPADEFGNTYIMVAIDGFSRFVVLEPAMDASGASESESVARFLLKLVGWFGRPKGIRTATSAANQGGLNCIAQAPNQ